MLTDHITPADIKLNLESTDREEAFAELTELLVKKYPEIKRSEVLNALITRENKCSTAVFPMVAVPHAVCDSAKETGVVIGISRQGIEFEPVDTADKLSPVVNVIFQIVFEKDNTDSHLNVLRDILFIVSKPDFHQRVLKAQSQQELYDLLVELEN